MKCAIAKLTLISSTKMALNQINIFQLKDLLYIQAIQNGKLCKKQHKNNSKCDITHTLDCILLFDKQLFSHITYRQ